jgi:hypothetical protein
MGVGQVFMDFLQRAAIGAGAVLVLLLFVQLGMPRRSPVRITRRNLN